MQGATFITAPIGAGFIVAFIGVSACAGNTQADVYQAVFGAEAGLAATETVTAQYLSGAFGAPDKAVAASLVSYDTTAYNTLEPFVVASETGAPISLEAFKAAQDAVAAYEKYVTDHKIGEAH